MRKTILFLSFALIALVQTAFAQIPQPQQQMRHPMMQQTPSSRPLVHPYRFYADFPDTATKVALLSVTDNAQDTIKYAQAIFKYAIMTKNNKPLTGGQTAFICKGACYDLWDANNNNSAYQILADSAIHHAIDTTGYSSQQ